MSAILAEAEQRGCVDIALRLIAHFSERDAKRGWLAYDETRKR